MIRLKPFIDISSSCPSCNKPVQPHDYLITGMHAMADIKCAACGKHLYMELPVNSGLFYPGMLDVATGDRCDTLAIDNWYLNGLVAAYKNRKDNKINVEVINNRPIGSKPVLLLNTIDATYGHALYELFNASYYLSLQQYDLVILVQRAMLWLVPEGAAQVWVTDISFSQGEQWHNDLALQVKELLKEIPDVFLCRSFQQADSNDFNITDYTKIPPFPLEQWNARLTKPTVTFIWRTDRFWRRVLPKVIDNRVSRKIMPGVVSKTRNGLQFNWILKFSKKLREAIPNLDFAIAGMDERTPPLPDWIKDFRHPKHKDETAREQVKRYAESHLVVGCNGSSLLLPGCMAGSVVDIVPGDQWSVSAGTFPFRVTSIGDTHFRYALVPCEVTIDRLVNIIVSILRDRAYVEIQTTHPWRDHASKQDHFAWSRYRMEALQVSEHFSTDGGMISTPQKQSS